MMKSIPFRRLAIWPLFVSVLLACHLAERPPRAETSPAAAAPCLLAPDPRLISGRLENGLTYLIRQHPEPPGRAEVWLAVDAGSLQEDDDQLGIAHFVEHMAFNGTRSFAGQTLVERLESLGLRLGPDVNASTGFDETLYTLQVPTDDPEDLALAFRALGEWAHGVTFEDAAVEQERGVVIEEWRQGRDAETRLMAQHYPVLYQGSRYARRLPIGEHETLASASPELLRRFYRDWYRPDLMAVIAVGDFEVETVAGWIRENFAQIPSARRSRPRISEVLPSHPETLFSIATDPEAALTRVGLYLKRPRKVRTRCEDYRDFLVESLFERMLDARLAERAREEGGPFLWAQAGSLDLVRAAEVRFQLAGVEDGGVERGLAELLAEVERIRRHGFLPAELERSKAELLGDYRRLAEERDTLPARSYAAEYLRYFLLDEPVPGIETELKLAEEYLDGISLARVEAMAADWLSEGSRVVLVSAPSSGPGPPPTEEKLRAVVSRVARVELEPWVDRAPARPLLKARPVPGPVIGEREYPELGVLEWILGNGARVLLKATDDRRDEVLFTGYSPGGTSLASDRDFLSATWSAAVIAEGGVGTFEPSELRKLLAGKRVEVAPYVGELEEGVAGRASPRDLETLLQWVYLSFTAPRPSPAALESLMTRTRLYLERRAVEPESILDDAVERALGRDHPRRRPRTAGDTERVDLETALAFYRDRFADASDFTFVLVGHFEPETIRPLVETFLGGLPSSGRRESWRVWGEGPPEGVVRLPVEAGREPRGSIRLVFPREVVCDQENLHRLDTVAQVLGKRLYARIREELGASYEIAVSGTITPRPHQVSRLEIRFGSAPERIDELVAEVFEEIETLRAGRVEDSELEPIREAQRHDWENRKRQNRFWLEGLKKHDFYLRDGLGTLLDFGRRIAEIDPAWLTASARRFIDPERYVLGVLHPLGTEPPACVARPAGSRERAPDGEAQALPAEPAAGAPRRAERLPPFRCRH